MRLQRSSAHPLVMPSQVWGGLTADVQAGAIRLMVRLASELVIQGFDSANKESTSCLQDSVTPRSAPRTSTATP